jgi:transcriptional regulator with XRE-family HTH domain
VSARDRKQIGATVRRLRKQRSMTQEDLAWRAGVNTTVVGRLERGERDPRLSTITAVARGLDVKPARLLDGLP